MRCWDADKGKPMETLSYDLPGVEEMSRTFKGQEFYDWAEIANTTDVGRRWETWSCGSWVMWWVCERFFVEPPWSLDDVILSSNRKFGQKGVCSGQYCDLDKTLDFIQDLLRRHEPLDGIFGFSQGANMASLLAAQATAGAGAKDAIVGSCIWFTWMTG